MPHSGMPTNSMRRSDRPSGCQLRSALGALWLWSLLALPAVAQTTASVPRTEYEVKALCVLNFAKYVEWPAGELPQTNSPIRIGVLGEGQMGRSLQAAVAGKSVEGHPFLAVTIVHDEDCSQCQILFISASEKKRQAEVLGRLKGSAILTVGESDQFIQSGGVINFIKKDGKVRFEVDLDAARQAHLQISSRLLTLADVVHGKS